MFLFFFLIQKKTNVPFNFGDVRDNIPDLGAIFRLIIFVAVKIKLKHALLLLQKSPDYSGEGTLYSEMTHCN